MWKIITWCQFHCIIKRPSVAVEFVAYKAQLPNLIIVVDARLIEEQLAVAVCRHHSFGDVAELVVGEHLCQGQRVRVGCELTDAYSRGSSNSIKREPALPLFEDWPPTGRHLWLGDVTFREPSL